MSPLEPRQSPSGDGTATSGRLNPYRLVSGPVRDRACRAVQEAPEGWIVTIEEPNRNSLQNALAHAALTEIAEQVTWHGKKFPMIVWKRLCMASWLREIGEKPEMIPALDGNGFDVIYERTSKLSVRKFSDFVEWVFAFGAQHGVKFKDGFR